MRFGLQCRRCGKQKPFEPAKTTCACGGSLQVAYDLERAGRTLRTDALHGRVHSMWRYAELLPVERSAHIVSLGEGWTPLLALEERARDLGLGALQVKCEERNPTGSFKARGASAALSVARAHGLRRIAINSNGNAASAAAAYAARAGMEAFAFLPADCPGAIVAECVQYGARTCLVDGLIHDAGRLIREGRDEQGWHFIGTLQEHGRAEGKKTMGLELAEQLGWRLPDVIVYPTGGGSGIIGMWRAFAQLRALGLIDGDLPRMVSVQAQGCAPIADAMRSGGNYVPLRGVVTSPPTGMRVPLPPDGEQLLAILRASGGTGVSVSEAEIADGARELGRCGVSASPEGAATWAGLLRLVDSGWIAPGERVVLFNTSHSGKYLPWRMEGVPCVKNYAAWRKLDQESAR
ncbi:threonine synthase [Paenibacillus sp. IB182496]|uniref:Threonine synthase n=1 Tax=Paenibacillus sabuli TaxID=2772509 RepID=A0A927BXC9_9BACL|nr:threonine synthase [Paenibacillus sabuli]MBD2847345.1 threonine synthase [Paenibacillus sabuli]